MSWKDDLEGKGIAIFDNELYADVLGPLLGKIAGLNYLPQVNRIEEVADYPTDFAIVHIDQAHQITRIRATLERVPHVVFILLLPYIDSLLSTQATVDLADLRLPIARKHPGINGVTPTAQDIVQELIKRQSAQ